jgi:hypothetical protein
MCCGFMERDSRGYGVAGIKRTVKESEANLRAIPLPLSVPMFYPLSLSFCPEDGVIKSFRNVGNDLLDYVEEDSNFH